LRELHLLVQYEEKAVSGGPGPLKEAARGNGSATGKGVVVYRDSGGHIRLKRGEGTVTGRGIAIGQGAVGGKGRAAGTGRATGRGWRR